MDEYISRYDAETAIAEIYSPYGKDGSGDAISREVAMSEIRNIPAADVRPVVHGEWEFEYENLDEQIEYCCSVCDWIGVNANEYNYCPNCGAKMGVQDGG